MIRCRTLGAIVLVGLCGTGMARADALGAGTNAFNRGDYNTAARLLLPQAERGSARAQGMVGFMHATGQGLPQAYDAATYWYRLAAEKGDVTSQYLLGLAYDKGQGVPQDEVAAYKWLNLAAAHAPKRMRENFAKLRNAVASKMSRGQIAAGQWHALRWPQDSDF
ncbi:Sel1 repeat-containing protein [Bradyrhizobium sp. R2.2-H]|uniref:tetratricopeptide repeat protein n=1 Tax=unclassified Bradyrhizobium TaxID=2631580 RepID=UPI00104F46D2|nr:MULTISPECIES: tetratricopeptide repeat protein [unclassified Bradyrhizobium]TCU76676.1 Sel1 repeat-containing protein [Bradyrhizobium sp. Y-H1]TCU79749.1 Sel1 repeat-containing protein [Bradyrhizobium sp. R2.2-H]